MIFPSDEDARFACGQLAAGCGTMERLLRGLLDSHGTVAAEVHAIRKLGKSLRGGFALFRLEKTSARDIQAIGRLLAGPRDAVSRLSTWNKLEWDDGTSVTAAIRGLLEQQTHSAARKPPLETIQWCLERVAEARKNLDAIPAEKQVQRIAKGLKKLRRLAFSRCAGLDHRSEEDFHDARKALKAYLGAVGFLPEGKVTPDPVMLELGETLGDENDLATLEAWLETHGFTRNFAAELRTRLKRTRKHLRKQLIRDAAGLSAGKSDC